MIFFSKGPKKKGPPGGVGAARGGGGGRGGFGGRGNDFLFALKKSNFISLLLLWAEYTQQQQNCISISSETSISTILGGGGFRGRGGPTGGLFQSFINQMFSALKMHFSFTLI